MTKNFDKLQKLSTALHDYEIKHAKLEADLKAKKDLQNELDDEALKAEILESKDLEQKQLAADENREIIKEIKEEIEKVQRAIELLKKERTGFESEALKEIQKHYRPELEKALREFYTKIKEANRAEMAVEKIRNEAQEKARSLGISSSVGLELTGPFEIFTLENPPGSSFYPIEAFVKRCKANGFNLG